MDELNHWCFACGKQNPIGLKLNFREEGDSYITTFIPQAEHQGYNGIVHGGIVSTLLDEVMAGYLYAKGYNAVTAKLDVRFRKPTPILQELTVTARITAKKRNMYEMTAEITLPDQSVSAEGKAIVAVTGERQP
jgi:acyl-coenzyme A thioesterase PaaI-like protein